MLVKSLLLTTSLLDFSGMSDLYSKADILKPMEHNTVDTVQVEEKETANITPKPVLVKVEIQTIESLPVVKLEQSTNSSNIKVTSNTPTDKFAIDQTNIRENIVNVAKTKENQTTYVFGGGRSLKDSNRNIFDCSSYIHYVFRLVGQELGPIESVTTETLNKIGNKKTLDTIEIGDLIFFDTYKKDGHVGIYIGEGKWIGAQTSTGVAIESVNDPYWQSVFSGHVRDVISP